MKHKIDKIYYRARKMKKKRIPLLPKILSLWIRVIYSADLSLDAEVDPSTTFMHNGLGVVVGKGTVIGKNCSIYQNTTFGGNGKSEGNGKPIVGNDVVIYAGSYILGGVTIGDKAVIGANSVVISDVPAGATAVGSPARIIHPKN